MSYFAACAVAPTKTKVNKPRQPFVLPAVSGKTRQYVCAINPDSPFSYLTVGGIDFQKRVLPPEASLTENDGKQFDYGYLVREFSENQIEAIFNRAKEKECQYRSDDGEILNSNVADHIILVPVEEFKDIVFNDSPVAVRDLSEEITDSLLNVQSKPPKKKK